MGRRKIEWFPGAIYYVTTRGNHRNDIFRDEEDYQVASESNVLTKNPG